MKIEEIIEDLGDGRYRVIIDTKVHVSPNPVFQVIENDVWGYYDKELTEKGVLLDKGDKVKLMACNLSDVGIFEVQSVNVWIEAKYLNKISGNLGLRVLAEKPKI